MINEKRELKDYIKQSFLQYLSNEKYSFKKHIKLFLTNEEYRFVVLLRKVQYYKEKNFILYNFYGLILKKMKIKYGIKISNSTKIGKGLCIIHSGGIIINQNTVIGENFKIRQNTTIGTNGVDELCPVIGNNVIVGAHVCIIGDIKIGDNVIIGAGSIVVKDVPDNVIVVGNPAKIIKMYNKEKNEYERIN